MRSLFGVVSLLVVLAIVGVVASRQFKATPAINAAASQPQAGTVRQQSQQIQDQVKSDVDKALAQSAAQREEADK